MDYIQVGNIINSHGLKGEVKLYPLTNDLERFNYLKTAYLGKDKLKVKIEKIKFHKGLVILKFKEFNDINEILDFKNDYLYVDRQNLVDLPKDTYFIFDLIDCDLIDVNGNFLGKIVDVIQSNANDVYVVKDKLIDKEYLIPAVKEFIKEVDIKNKTIIIDPIEGMIV